MAATHKHTHLRVAVMYSLTPLASEQLFWDLVSFTRTYLGAAEDLLLQSFPIHCFRLYYFSFASLLPSSLTCPHLSSSLLVTLPLSFAFYFFLSGVSYSVVLLSPSPVYSLSLISLLSSKKVLSSFSPTYPLPSLLLFVISILPSTSLWQLVFLNFLSLFLSPLLSICLSSPHSFSPVCPRALLPLVCLSSLPLFFYLCLVVKWWLTRGEQPRIWPTHTHTHTDTHHDQPRVQHAGHMLHVLHTHAHTQRHCWGPRVWETR